MLETITLSDKILDGRQSHVRWKRKVRGASYHIDLTQHRQDTRKTTAIVLGLD